MQSDMTVHNPSLPGALQQRGSSLGLGVCEETSPFWIFTKAGVGPEGLPAEPRVLPAGQADQSQSS